MSLCILIPAIVGLISGILGYLLGKMAGGSSSDNSSLQAELDACRSNTTSLKSRISTLEGDLVSAKTNTSAQSFTSSTPSFAFDANLAATVMGKKVKQDDLKIVEGIGPKIEELYHNAGIKTWKALSETATNESQKILDDAGNKFTIHNPETWAKQALLAYEGKWNELKEWQDSLDGGR